jgi:hypothetical protein
VDLKLRVEVEVRATELEDKVRKAVENIFPNLKLEMIENKLIGESAEVSAISKFHQLLRLQLILDSARSVFFAGRRGNRVQFMLNKQVAFVGKISFTDGESPLGPISVVLEAPDIERLIDYLAPRTKDGKPIEEISYP